MEAQSRRIDETTGIELLYRGKDLTLAEFDLTEDVQAFIDNHDLLNVHPALILKGDRIDRSAEWIVPERYADINIVDHLLDLCTNEPNTKASIERVYQELKMFQARNLMPMLRLMIYIVDTMRERQVVWGVGRGSSVASYCLYLIGVHHIDSIKYDLDIREFLK